MTQKSNKTIVLEFYKYVIGQRDTSLLDTYVSDQYIQHSPMVKDGKAGLKEAIDYLKQMPEVKEKKSPITRVIEDQNYVVAQLHLVFMGKRKMVIDLFRLENGKIAEHWDAVQDYPEGVSDKISTIDGGAAVEEINLTNKNKSLVQHFFQEIIGNKRTGTSSDYLDPGYIEHNPEVVKTTGNLDVYLSDWQGHCRSKIHRIIGEGNFVAIQSEGLKNHNPFVFYDILRVKNNKIVEHWSVEQAIPESIAHKNGMI